MHVARAVVGHEPGLDVRHVPVGRAGHRGVRRRGRRRSSGVGDESAEQIGIARAFGELSGERESVPAVVDRRGGNDGDHGVGDNPVAVGGVREPRVGRGSRWRALEVAHTKAPSRGGHAERESVERRAHNPLPVEPRRVHAFPVVEREPQAGLQIRKLGIALGRAIRRHGELEVDGRLSSLRETRTCTSRLKVSPGKTN